MEFLRFGSSIPGGYWGCCACCIIQNFKVDPDAPASIQLVSGDGGGGITAPGGGFLYAGPTYRDIFEQRIRSGTFDTREMPNHAFIAILTDWQITSGVGKQWMEILKANGFEFIRTVSNSVYTGQTVGGECSDSSMNYIFGLFRNIGSGGTVDQLKPPEGWTDLPKVKSEAWELYGTADTKEFTQTQRSEDTAIWKAGKPPKFLTEAEVKKAGAPVTLAGLRVDYGKPLSPEDRERIKTAALGKASVKADPNPFGKSAPTPSPIAV
jgi:hypothetical protein